MMIRVRNLEKRYGSRLVLRGVDLDVSPGQRLALVGPNGSGKTTLMRCLLGLVTFRGEVRIDGFDSTRDHAQAASRVAYVPQRAPALPATVAQVVSFWSQTRGIPGKALDEAIALFGLDRVALAEQRFTALSGGTQQKVLAATALASRCPVLLFDEPTANLDPAARKVFLDTLARLKPAPAVVLSSHRLEELDGLVDRVVILAEGRIAGDESWERFAADPALAALAGLSAPGVHFDPPPLHLLRRNS